MLSPAKIQTLLAILSEQSPLSVLPSSRFTPIAERICLRAVMLLWNMGSEHSLPRQYSVSRHVTQRCATRSACRRATADFSKENTPSSAKIKGNELIFRECTFARKNMSVRERRSLVLLTNAWWTR